MSVEPGTQEAVPVVAAGGSATARVAPMRGITVGALDAAPTGPDTTEIRRTVGGQALAGTLFVVGLVPAIVMALVFGLTHRANLISSSPVWAWSACGIALAAVVVSALRAGRSGAVGWARPVVLAVVLLVPAVRLTQHVPAQGLTIAAIVLYVVTLIALLFTTLGTSE